MLQGDGYSNGRFREHRIGLRNPLSFELPALQLRRRLQRRLFEHDRAMRYLHLAGDVQVMTGIRLRQVPAVFRQR